MFITEMRAEIHPAVLQSCFRRERGKRSATLYRRVESESVLLTNGAELEPRGGMPDKIMDGTEYIVPAPAGQRGLRERMVS